MPNYILVTALLLSFSFDSILTCIDIPTNLCTIDAQTQICRFNELQLNSTHPYFEPESEIPSKEVTRVNLGGIDTPRQGSKIYTLTNEYCDTFPNMEELNSASVDLQGILDGAFTNCRNLKVLRLDKNSLFEINSDVLEYTTKLLFLDISDNLIKDFDMKILESLTNLRALDVSVNFLTVFDVKKIGGTVPQLRGIILRENQLTTLDEKDIVNKFPALEYFYFCPNMKIDRSRMQQIVDYLEDNDIDVMRETCPVSRDRDL